MKRVVIISIAISMIITGCNNENIDTEKIEKYKQEIIQTEKDFALLVKEKGMAVGFYTYAATDAVLNRDSFIIKGNENIRKHYENSTLKNIVLEWKPDFVDVASSGELGYTYGHYNFSADKPEGTHITSKGIFHTVWKRQPDGKWKFVWD